MKYITFILTQTARNFKQAWGSQLMTLLTVSLSVLFFTFFFLIYNNMLQAASRLGDELRLIVYLDEEVKPSLQAGYEKRIRDFSEVEKIIFISPQESFEQLKKQLGNDRDVLDDLDASFLPHSIEIYLKHDLENLSLIKEFSEYLSTLPSIMKVQYGHGWIERFSYFMNLLRMIVLLSGTLLALTATFMVSYTIR
ncbi:MAG: permease-like cell division protein FtsX, partial [Desulfobulbaceae bacterium]|nr:permease-like cell division protein FtsX [Desulfobulbaceae bacterium]